MPAVSSPAPTIDSAETPADDDLIGAREAEALAGLARGTIGKLVTAGKLEAHVKLPGTRGAYVFRRGDIKAFAAERRRKLEGTLARMGGAS